MQFIFCSYFFVTLVEISVGSSKDIIKDYNYKEWNIYKEWYRGRNYGAFFIWNLLSSSLIIFLAIATTSAAALEKSEAVKSLTSQFKIWKHFGVYNFFK